MEKGTPIAKLTGLEFYVYLYLLDVPRKYEGLEKENTIGAGYVGLDTKKGIGRIQKVLAELKTEIPYLKKRYGPSFPDQYQYEFFNRLEKDLSITIGKNLMNREETENWINQNLRNIEEAEAWTHTNLLE